MIKLIQLTGKRGIFTSFKEKYPDEYQKLFDTENEMFLDKRFNAKYGQRYISSFLDCELTSCQIDTITDSTDLEPVHTFIADLMKMKVPSLEKMKALITKDYDPFNIPVETIEEIIVTSGTSTGTTQQETESTSYGYNSDTPSKDGGETNQDSHDTSTSGETTRNYTKAGVQLNGSVKETIDSELERLKEGFTKVAFEVYRDMFTLSIY